MASPAVRKPSSVQIIQTSGAQFTPPNAFYKPPPNQIRGVVDAPGAWWTAGQPIIPIAPSDTSPRGWQYLSEQNKIFTPRTTEFLTYDDLRRLATYPVAAIMITLHANAIAARQFRIRLRQLPGMNNKKREEAEKGDQKIQQLTNFFMNPNPDNTWREFVYMWMTETMITDAPAVFVRRNARRDIAELRLVDGTMIARYIDDNGWTPSSESPAYAQLWWGTPAWDLSRDQLLYRPKCPRVWKLYGNSSTERSARLIELGYSRLELKMQWAQNGTIPDGLQIVPPDAPVELVERQQAWMNSMMTGNQQRRVQLRLIQGFSKDGKDQLLFPKEKMLMDPYDEYEIRMLAVNYDVPKQRFMQMMTRSTAESAQEAAEEEGYGPSYQYLRDSCNLLIQSPLYFNLPNYEFTFADEREHDIVKQAQADDYYIRNGVKTWTEVRDDLGLDARTNPMDTVPLAFGQGLVVSAYDSAGIAQASKQPKLSGGEGDDNPEGEVIPPAAKPPKKSRLAGRLVLDAEELEELNKNGILAMIASSRRNHQFSKVHPGMSIDPHHFSLQGETARNNLETKVKAYLAQVCDKFVAKIQAKKARKTQDEDDIKKLLGDDAFWTELWIALPPELTDDLEEAVRAGMAKGLLEADVKIDSSSAIKEFNAIAQAYAKNRAAELVGMAYDDAGELAPNPRAQYVISDTTRNELRRIITESFEHNTKFEDLIKDIQDAGAFSGVRAQLIAKTEVSHAQAGGTYSVWQKTGVVQTCQWQTSNLENVCPECEANEDQGEVEFGKPFGSGDLFPPAHPNCLIAGTLVAAADGVTAHFTRPFEGEVVTIALVNGEELTITPNHPVLADCGWMAPLEVQEGMYLPYCGDQRRLAMLAVEPDDNLMPAVIEQVPRALLVSGSVFRGRMPSSAEDFHGDGIADSEVDVVGPTSAGKDELDLGICKHCGKTLFAEGHLGNDVRSAVSQFDRSSAFAENGGRWMGSAHGIMSSHGARRPLLGTLFGHTEEIPLPDSARWQSKSFPVSNEIPTTAVKGFGSLGTSVPFHVESMRRPDLGFPTDAALTLRPRRSQHFASAAQHHASSTQLLTDSIALNADNPRNICDRLARLIQLTRVRNVYRTNFSGHVFNLETRSGYYAANGFIVHNCRCVVYAKKVGKAKTAA